MLQEIGVEEHDGDVRFYTESENIVDSRMRSKNMQCKPYLWRNRVLGPRFPHLTGNRGRGRRWCACAVKNMQ